MNGTIDRASDLAAGQYRDERISFWNRMASTGAPHDQSAYYHERLTDIYRFLVPTGLRVLEIGCGTGDLLASLSPAHGVGVDFSPAMLRIARERHPNLSFVEADAHDTSVTGTFDVVILSDLLNDVWDVQAVFERILPMCDPSTRIIVNFYNKAWQGPLRLARSLGLAKPELAQNWLSRSDVSNLMQLAGFDVVRSFEEILAPVRLGLISRLLNRIVVKVWPIGLAGLTSFVIARPSPQRREPSSDLSVSVIVAARNESGNIDGIIERTPKMGSNTELIFVEGNSTDDTYEAIERAMERPGSEHVSLHRQPGSGKGDAVRHGFAHASGDVLMILDADMTVAPEELPRFYEAVASGTGEFINGVRLVYPMEGEAMQFLNYLGNKLFGLSFTWLLGQPVKDTLCGTKVLTRAAYDKIAANRHYFGDFDPFGDFDLLFGAAKLNLKIVDMPIRYRDRTYGTTNISRWRHGALLLRMVAFATRKLRFT